MFLEQSFQVHCSILHFFLEKKINTNFISLAIWPEGSCFLMKDQICTALLWMSRPLLCQVLYLEAGYQNVRPLLTLTSCVTLSKSLNQFSQDKRKF